MKDERIVEEMGKLDPHGDWHVKGIFNLEDHNAVQRVIDGLSGRYSVRNGEYHEFLYQADCVASRDFYKPEHDETFIGMDHIPLMTPRQKCEAILRAKGLWDD